MNSRRSWMRQILTMAFLVSLIPFAQASDWRLDKDEDGVQLYSKFSENSQLKTVKVVSQVKSSLSGLVSFLSDNTRFPSWMERVSKAETIKDISPSESLTYTVIDSPWPERDRDSVLYSKWEQDPNTLVVTKKIYSEPGYVETSGDKIRAPLFEGEWTLTPRGNGMVEVAYSVDFEPGGKVQGWLLEMFTYEMPFKTMKNLQTATFDKYERQRVAFIREPVPGS